MSTEDPFASPSPGEPCLVCGQRIEPGRGAVRLQHQGATIDLCGLDCRKAFAREPALYLARLAQGERCVVCEKSLAFGGGNAHVNHRGTTVYLCGPYCMAAFARDPDPYLARLAGRALQATSSAGSS